MSRTSPHLHFTLILAAIAAIASSGCDRNSGLSGTASTPPTKLRVHSFVDDARPEKSEPVAYRPPTLAERLAFEDKLGRLFDSLSDQTVEFDETFGPTGLRLQLLEEGRFVALFEGGDSWRGTGVYVFRTGHASDVLLQAPHGYHDQHTAEIAWAAFRQSQARAFYFNTMHRYRATPGEGKRTDDVHRADLAHNTDSYFYVATDQFLRRHPDGTVVQLHGFDRRSLSKKGFEIVVSDGTDAPGEVARQWTARLRDEFGEDAVALYAEDVRQLGASSNTIGRLVRLTRRGHFVHLEFSPEFRERLLRDVAPLSRTLE
jgi:hypothetical protein